MPVSGRRLVADVIPCSLLVGMLSLRLAKRVLHTGEDREDGFSFSASLGRNPALQRHLME